MKSFKLVLIISLFALSSIGFAQLAEPGDGGGGTSGAPGPVGGGAPIGSGIAMIISLGVAYGAGKTIKLSKERK